MQRDLEGLLVVSVEHAVAAPYASSRLADAGARVIKFERTDGDFARRYDAYVNGESSYFVWLNRGKESAFIDIKQRDDVDLLLRILQKADVFLQNLAPGAAERAGFGSASLRERFPRLITCDITGYGSDGAYRDMKAYDLLVQAETGLALLTGTENEPGRVGVSVCDIACGMYAHQAILQALIARHKSGEGRAIEVSLFHSMAEWMNVPYLQYRYGGHQPARSGLNHPTIAPYGAYPCADGSKILISIQNEREWERLCGTILGRPELSSHPLFATNTLRVAHRAQLDDILVAAFKHVMRDQLASRMSEAQIAFGNLSTLEDLTRHPQIKTVWVRVKDEIIELLAPPAFVADMDRDYGTVPAAGADDARIRREFEFTAALHSRATTA